MQSVDAPRRRVKQLAPIELAFGGAIAILGHRSVTVPVALAWGRF
ncbi:hypothetical protein [Cribrihabitans neustonicus]